MGDYLVATCNQLQNLPLKGLGGMLNEFACSVFESGYMQLYAYCIANTIQ